MEKSRSLIHDIQTSFFKIPSKGNHILKFYTLLIDLACAFGSEIFAENILLVLRLKNEHITARLVD